MDELQAKKITDTIFKDVFGRIPQLSLEQIEKKYAPDIKLPKEVVCLLSGEKTWATSPVEKPAKQSAIIEKFKKSEWMQKKQPINSLDDLFLAWERVSYVTTEKEINSQGITKSDNILNSINVYKCDSIFTSKNIVFSQNILDSLYMLASKGCASCTYGIRVRESELCSSSFEVSWCGKVSKSMFIHNSLDLYECMFCSHIRSRKYCIANMQFEKEEYFRVKKMVLDWLLK